MKHNLLYSGLVLSICYSLISCQKTNEVVVYTSHDRNISEPILNQFEKDTGISVRAVYDTEANKTTGIVNRLIAEQRNPRADVFWNNEFLRTLHLQELGILVKPNSVKTIKNIFLNSKGNKPFNGFAARARVFIINSKQVMQQAPSTLIDLTNKKWFKQVAFANPHFGTTGTHFSALLSYWGEDKFRNWIKALKINGAAMLPGNAQVRDQVVLGRYKVGLTDTDDVNSAILAKKKIKMVIPGQVEKGIGVFLIPNTVSQVKNGPNTKEGKMLINFLLQAKIETALANSRAAQIPILNSVIIPKSVLDIRSLKLMKIDPIQVSKKYQKMLLIFTSVWNN